MKKIFLLSIIGLGIFSCSSVTHKDYGYGIIDTDWKTDTLHENNVSLNKIILLKNGMDDSSKVELQIIGVPKDSVDKISLNDISKISTECKLICKNDAT